MVPAACSLMAWRSLTKLFSVEAKRRWTAERRTGARSWATARGAVRRIWRCPIIFDARLLEALVRCSCGVLLSSSSSGMVSGGLGE